MQLLRDIIFKLDKIIVWLSHNIAAALLAFAAVLVFFQVFTRFILGDSAAWTEILARGIIVWVVFLGSAATFRHGAMISIQAISRALSSKANLLLQRVVTVLTLIFLGILVWWGYLMAVKVSHQSVSMLEVSMSWFYSAIPLGAACAMIAVLARHFEMEANPELAGEITFDEAEEVPHSKEVKS